MRYPSKKIMFAVIIPVIFALIARGLFGLAELNDFFVLMNLAFLFFVPFGLGALTINLSPIEKVYSLAYRICMPWVPILIFFIVTTLLSIEGWACWIMIMPLFLVAASVGGFIAGFIKIENHKNEKKYISLIVLLPLFISPIEQRIAKIPGRYKADTYIDIHAGKEQIWNNVTRVREIGDSQDKGWFTRFLGFPRPIKAELDFEGKGGFRKAIFDKGLIFDETVTDYEHQRKMSFTIKANPHDIPSTTMDEHIVVGGDYFDVLNGNISVDQGVTGLCYIKR